MEHRGMLRPTRSSLSALGKRCSEDKTLYIHFTPPLTKPVVGSRTFTAPLLLSPLIFSVLSSRCQQVGKLGHVLRGYLSLALSVF